MRRTKKNAEDKVKRYLTNFTKYSKRSFKNSICRTMWFVPKCFIRPSRRRESLMSFSSVELLGVCLQLCIVRNIRRKKSSSLKLSIKPTFRMIHDNGRSFRLIWDIFKHQNILFFKKEKALHYLTFVAGVSSSFSLSKNSKWFFNQLGTVPRKSNSWFAISLFGFSERKINFDVFSFIIWVFIVHVKSSNQPTTCTYIRVTAFNLMRSYQEKAKKINRQ